MAPKARPSRSGNRPDHKPDHGDPAEATQVLVKEEDTPEDDDTYRPRPQLPVSIVLKRDLRELIKFLEAGVIDIDPEYQREVVWTADRMTGLIDSLMENFYIPPIILNKKPRLSQNGAASQETLVCVDGKQRLSSILAFVKGLIPCHDHRGEKWWFCEPAGSKRKRVLSEQLQKQFFKKEFVSFEFTNLSPEQEEDLFARVQMGVQLNLAEKMRASTGPWQELARLFVEDFPAVYELMKDRARSKDFQITLSCFSQILECMHPTNANGVPILKTNHTHLPKLLNNKDAVDDALKSHLASVWNTFKDLIEADPDTFTNGNKYLRGVQTFAPVEMVAVTVLISTHSETRNNRLLLGDIQAMRTAVRENFVDLRLNVAVWKWFWEYIDELEGIRGAIDGSTVNRNTSQRTKKTITTSTAGPTAGPTAAAITAAAAAPKKGRSTARTKRPAVTVAEETHVVVKQETEMTTLSYVRPSKRGRTGDSPVDGTAMSEEYFATLPRSTIAPLTSEGRGGLTARSLEQMRGERSFPPMPAQASTQSPAAQPMACEPRARNGPAPSAPPSTASMLRTDTNPIDDVQRRSNRKSLLTPSEARQQRVSELNNYRSFYQTSSATVQSPLLDGNSRTHSADQPRAHTARLLASPGADNIPTRIGPFLTGHDHSQWRGNHKPVEPEVQVNPQLPQSRANSTQSTSDGAIPLPTYGQCREPIDLSSDTEQERQNLLSAFKTKPATLDIPGKTEKATMATPATQKPVPAAKRRRYPWQESPIGGNNPYAGLKSK